MTSHIIVGIIAFLAGGSLAYRADSAWIRRLRATIDDLDAERGRAVEALTNLRGRFAGELTKLVDLHGQFVDLDHSGSYRMAAKDLGAILYPADGSLDTELRLVDALHSEADRLTGRDL